MQKWGKTYTKTGVVKGNTFVRKKRKRSSGTEAVEEEEEEQEEEEEEEVSLLSLAATRQGERKRETPFKCI